MVTTDLVRALNFALYLRSKSRVARILCVGTDNCPRYMVTGG